MIKLDGPELNEAAWLFVKEYESCIGEKLSGHLFNNLKFLLKPTIERYLELMNTAKVEALAGVRAAEAASRIDTRSAIWNAAVESAALVVQPVPHIEEERTFGEIATAIRRLRV